MIKLTFHTLDNTTPAANGKTVYQQFRYDLIRNAEGTVPNVYLDTNNQNLPTIGIGGSGDTILN